jgi:hypothetical protein
MRYFRFHELKVLAIGLSCFAAGAMASESLIELHHDAAAYGAAATHASPVYRHARPTSHAGVSRGALEYRSVAAVGRSSSAATSGPRYPGDLEYQGGQFVTSMQSHAIFVNCASSCWGDPLGFLSDLGRSNFIHVVDQYVGTTADDRYTVGQPNFTAAITGLTNPLVDADIVSLVYEAATISGESGYGHEYHVFLAPGMDECFDTTYSVCYSPDNAPSFFFCAYHGSFDAPGVGHVLYSVEPFQNVPGCMETGPSPNGALTDSTNNVLSHETFETITDPDGTAWWNILDNGLYGQEIGDECSFINATGFDPSVFHVHGKVYAAQPEYSNAGHTCASAPVD